MTALTGNRDTRSVLYHTPPYAVPVAAGAVIYQGAMVAANATGYLVPATSSPTLCILGRAAESYDNSGGADGASVLNVDSGMHFWSNGGAVPVTDADIGAFCYAVDDQTVTMSGSGRSVAGIVRDVSQDGVLVDQVSTVGFALTDAIPIAWEAQANWYVDPSAGADTNDGSTALTAIATLGELQRRLTGRTVAVAMNIYLIGPLHVGSLHLVVDFIEDGSITIHGQRTVLAEGTVSASQAWVPATKTPGWIEAIDIPGTWSDYIGKLVRFPNRASFIGDATAACFVMVDQGTGNKRARVGPRTIYEDPYGILAPEVGETFEICDITRVDGSIVIDSTKGKTPGGYVAIYWVNAEPTDETLDGIVSDGGNCFFIQCITRGYESGSRGSATETSFDTCYLDGYKFTASSGTTFVDFGSLVGAMNVAPSAVDGATLSMGDTVSQASQLFAIQPGGRMVVQAGTWIAACDTSIAGILYQHSCAEFFGQLWGANIGTTLLQMRKTSSAIISPGTYPLDASGALTNPVTVASTTLSLVNANLGHVDADSLTRLVVW